MPYFGLNTLMMSWNNVCSFVHNLHKQRNCPDKADQHSHFNYQQPLARCRFCLPKLFLFHFPLISLSRLSSWAALEESQRCLKTERPHRETNNVSPFNKMLANGQHNGWLAGKQKKKRAAKWMRERRRGRLQNVPPVGEGDGERGSSDTSRFTVGYVKETLGDVAFSLWFTEHALSFTSCPVLFSLNPACWEHAR